MHEVDHADLCMKRLPAKNLIHVGSVRRTHSKVFIGYSSCPGSNSVAGCYVTEPTRTMLSFSRPSTTCTDRGSLVMLSTKPKTVPDSTSSIHIMLDNYSRQTTQTEKLIADMQQQQQDVMEDHATAATSLSSATAEAENAEEVAAFLAAELHQLQIEVAVKQADISELRTKLSSIGESRTAVAASMAEERMQLIRDCKELDTTLRQMQQHRAGSGSD